MYQLSTVATLLLAFGGLTAAAPKSSKYVLHEERHEFMPAHQLQARSKLAGRHVLPMRIGLTQRGLDGEGHDWLMDVSHPESPNYGKHWTAAAVNKAFAPTAETVQSVRDWLMSAGIDDYRITVSDNKGWLAFDSPVEEVERLFRTSYYEHQHHADENKFTIGCDSYYLPEHIAQHIDYITPGVKHQEYKREFLEAAQISKRDSSIRRRSAGPVYASEYPAPAVDVDVAAINAAAVPANCSYQSINVACLHALYNLPALDPTRKVNPKNSLGIFEQQNQTFAQEDLNLFFKNLAPTIPKGTTPILAPIDGGVSVSGIKESGGEALLDLTIAYAIMWPQSISYFETDDYYYQHHYYYKGFGDTLLDALDGSFCTYSAFGQKGDDQLIDPVYPDPHQGGYKGPLQCGLYEPTSVISFSYGPGEDIWPVAYERRQCNEWMKMALMGTTGVFASGDQGVEGQITDTGRDRNCLGVDAKIFAPGFPASCPYVLTVGATQIKPGVSGYTKAPERAVFSGTYPNTFTSGGGFSNVFPIPDYQTDAVKKYFATVNNTLPSYSTEYGKNIGANGGVYNRAGRGIPDVSANGAFWDTYVNGGYARIGGTSQSTPLFAGVLNLINEERMRAGKSTVGYLHPVIYAHPEVFTDIVNGHNDGCGNRVAFEAAPGWDPVTGLGTPIYPKLLELFMSLP